MNLNIFKKVQYTYFNSKSHNRKNKGFSLLEVLVVMMIIALLIALVGPRFINQLEKSKVTTARAQIASLHSALNSFYLDIGRYPSKEEGLEILIREPEGEIETLWYGPYLDDDKIPLDPWGRAYQYETSDLGSKPKIISYGADGKEGGEKLNADITK